MFLHEVHGILQTAPKDGFVAVKTVAVKNEPKTIESMSVAVENGSGTVQFNRAFVDKSIRIALCKMLTTRQGSIREAVVGECMGKWTFPK